MDKPETESKLTLKRDGILYKLNSREPYSGIVFQHFANGNLEFCASYVNGRLEGVKDTYNSNGVLASTTTYFNGEKNGLKSGIMSFTVQKDVEEEKIKTNHVEFFRT